MTYIRDNSPDKYVTKVYGDGTYKRYDPETYKELETGTDDRNSITWDPSWPTDKWPGSDND